MENDRVSLRDDDLAVLVDRVASFLRTRPPVAQQEEQILHANVAAVVEVRETISLLRTRPPGAQQEEQVLHTNVAAVVEVPGALALVGDAVAVLIGQRAGRDLTFIRDAVVVTVGTAAVGQIIGIADAVPVSVVVADAKVIDILLAVERRRPSQIRADVI